MKTAAQYEELKTPCQVSLVFDLVTPVLEGKRVLDVGCATGDYLSRFSKTSVGLDYSNRNLLLCREKKKLAVVKADFNEGLPVLSGAFDVVFCTHVIEHVDSPLYLLREMDRAVCRHGLVVLSYPVESSLARLILRDHYFDAHPSHLYSFSLNGVRRLIEKTGLIPEKILLDFPLLRRFGQVWVLRLMQFIPRRIGMLLAGNLWLICRKK